MTPLRILLLALVLGCGTAQAAIEAYKFNNTEQEQRFHKLTKELRCLVCQNQDLADSNADLAADLRGKVQEMILAGKTDKEIVDYMVDRYGDFVLYKPPLMGTTVLLWFGPGILAVLGVLLVIGVIRRRSGEPVPELSAEDHQRAESLLHDDPPGK
jgi:cytochrome c-type biogenesis protein CcmH